MHMGVAYAVPGLILGFYILPSIIELWTFDGLDSMG